MKICPTTLLMLGIAWGVAAEAHGQYYSPRGAPPPPPPMSTSPMVQTYDHRGIPNPDAFDWTGVAIGMSVGTAGIGMDGTFYIADWLNFRLSANYFSFVYKTTEGPYDYEYDKTALGMLFLFDWYPGSHRGFRFTTGVALRDNEVSIYGTPQRSVLAIGGNTYTAEQAGNIRGTAEYDLIAPYVGIGFGNAVRPDAMLTFTMDIGLIYQGYDLSLRADGSASGDGAFQSDFNALRSDVEKVLDDLKVYPVITFGLAYHF